MQHAPCPVRRLTPEADGWHYFFGYYDRCPWDEAGSRLLAHRARFLDRFPSPDDEAEVGLLVPDGDAHRFEPLGRTLAWNWQQGAQLRWVRTPAGERVLYNDRRDGAPVAVEVDPGTRAERVIPWPLYAVTPDGRTGFTLSFGRLSRLRPEYGLPGLDDPFAGDPAPAGEGVWRVDLESGERTLIAGYGALGSHSPETAGAGRRQHVNHIMPSPSGTRVCFLHRFEREDGIMHSRLFTVGSDGSDLRLLMEGMVSHYDWRDDGTILAWAGRRALLGGSSGPRSPAQRAMSLARRGLKPVYYALGKPRILMNRVLKDSYLLIPDEPDAQTTPFAPGELYCDGHCTFGPDRRWVVTDGYPDLRGRQPLFLWDCERDAGFEIGRYPTPRALDGPTRVDLHPRFDREGQRVCIDSAMDGSRAMYEVDVSSVVGLVGLVGVVGGVGA